MTEVEKRIKSERESMDRFEVFPWNKNFETGNATIDEQHKKLVYLLNELARTLIFTDPIKVNKAFEELADYAESHFSAEELIWSEFFEEDDHWLTSHQISHAAFLPKVVEIKERGEGQLEDVIENIVRFLIRWLAFHIIDNDKRMAFATQIIQSGTPLHEAKVEADKKMSGSMRLLIETILNMYDTLSSGTIAMMKERNARLKVEAELKDAVDELRTLKGILPICAHCKKIRNEIGGWDQLETFIHKHSEASFSHTICPECVDKHFSEFKP